ncbi:MAG: hypothetical protein J6Y91_03650 [Alphaproteobacteria bacterium]|nr:hypothetical protein [Alphaproteobacteria bacterium]
MFNYIKNILLLIIFAVLFMTVKNIYNRHSNFTPQETALQKNMQQFVRQTTSEINNINKNLKQTLDDAQQTYFNEMDL